ncbi:hypothetical protein [Streptomyces kebangsaanensis]|uniref:hypothetical protein n=1 Tax=Streptomyces kebangsaanensis TaxID=864058 RepID=UPI00093A1443|nr:hypothetical protein [Streptomyces kebangsaanensis]
MFTQRFSSTPLGARLARHLALVQLHTWDVPHGTPLSDAAATIVGKPAADRRQPSESGDGMWVPGASSGARICPHQGTELFSTSPGC